MQIVKIKICKVPQFCFFEEFNYFFSIQSPHGSLQLQAKSGQKLGY
jgi:hypothetical protein